MFKNKEGVGDILSAADTSVRLKVKLFTRKTCR